MINSTRRSEFVTDTIGLVLRIEDRKLPSNAKSIFDSVESGKSVVYVPVMVFAEVLYLSEKGKIKTSLHEVGEYLKRYPNYKEYPISFAVVQSASQILDISELHDRLIAGTSRFLNVGLITNDPIIQASKFVKTVW